VQVHVVRKFTLTGLIGVLLVCAILWLSWSGEAVVLYLIG
jgi:hypothetical protein